MSAWLVHNAVAAGLLALLTLAATRFLRRHPNVLHLMWVATLARLLLPPLPSAAEEATVSSAAAVFSTQPSTVVEDSMRWMTRTFGGQWSVWVEWGIVSAWAIGVVVVLCCELRGIARVQRLLRSAKSAPAGALQRIRPLAERMGVRTPQLRILPGTSGPFLWSLARPVLVLPDSRAGSSTPLLAHELAHLARRDHLACWLELVACCLHWWNPVFWLARSRVRLCAELACDANVMRAFPERREEYARSLLETAERTSRAPSARALGVIGSGMRELETRLLRIMNDEPDGEQRRPVGVACHLGLFVLLTGLSLPGLIVPSGDDLLPDYPRGSSANAVLDSYGVGGWDELLAQANLDLRSEPTAGDALRRKGMALLGLGDHAQATEVFLEQAALGYRTQLAYYNAACAQALARNLEDAQYYLELALVEGFGNLAALEQDPDLDQLRSNPNFQALLNDLQASQATP